MKGGNYWKTHGQKKHLHLCDSGVGLSERSVKKQFSDAHREGVFGAGEASTVSMIQADPYRKCSIEEGASSGQSAGAGAARTKRASTALTLY